MSKEFIKSRSLEKYRDVDLNIDNLPVQSIYGTSFMIKNNSIIQISSCFTTDDDLNITFDTKKVQCEYKSTVIFHNIDIIDISNFSKINQFKNKAHIYAYSIDDITDFICVLSKGGFIMYLKKVQ